MTAASGPRHQDAGTSAAPGPPMRWSRVFPGDARQLSILRRWLESLLPDCPARGDVASVATELGANAIQHTASGHGGSFTVEITWHRSAVRVAVADSGSPAELRVIDDLAGEHGRGMLLVQGLSVRTGIIGDHRGRLIWADIPWNPTEAVAATSAQDPYEAAIDADQAGLTSRFTGVQAWFGRSTLQWWALAGGEIVTAPSAQELGGLLDHVLASPTLRTRAAADTTSAAAMTKPATHHERRPGEPAPRLSPARASVADNGPDYTDLGGRDSLSTPFTQASAKRDDPADQPSKRPRPPSARHQLITTACQPCERSGGTQRERRHRPD